MQLNEFQGLALRTESQVSGLKLDKHNIVVILKAVVAITEILDAVKKAAFYNKTTKVESQLVDRINEIYNLIHLLDNELVGKSPKDVIVDEQETLAEVDPRVFHGIIGIITEAGELAEALRKVLEGETKLDAVNVQEEMSDIAWYKAILHDALNLDWGQGLRNVINKLRIRYPEKYSDQAAAERNLDAERAALEVGVTSSASTLNYSFNGTPLSDADNALVNEALAKAATGEWYAPAGTQRGTVPEEVFVTTDYTFGYPVESTAPARRVYYIEVPNELPLDEVRELIKEAIERKLHPHQDRDE